jgi:pimeloyl-ACP methyl ester carboxylesterase
MTSNDSQRLILPDGRILGYAEYGNSAGYPIMYFHGFPSSRLDGTAADRAARKNGIRFITMDRPGFGLSTFQPQRRITDWPSDIHVLAQHLKLDRFAVLGGSGGGPYAIACAHLLPRDRLSAVGVMAGAPPWDIEPQYMPLRAKLTAAAARYWPSGLRAVTNTVLSVLRWLVTTAPVTRWLDKVLGALREQHKERLLALGEELDAETEALTTAQRRERSLRILFEAFAQGAAGAVHEARLLSSDWGFDLRDVTYCPVRVWHGTNDTNAPIRLIRSMAARLPHCDLREFQGLDHYQINDHLEEILLELIPRVLPQDQDLISETMVH